MADLRVSQEDEPPVAPDDCVRSTHHATIDVAELPLLDRLTAAHSPLSFDIELTARCNNDCRHCYINLSASDSSAQAAELTSAEILDIGRQAVAMGTVWCLLTGGEPLLRDDFIDIYLGLRRLGLLVSVFTNACLVDSEIASLFHRYPPRDVEVTVYGATAATYEAVTRQPGSFAAFERGLDLLLAAGVQVRLKAVALRSNIHEFDHITSFCRERTKDFYRFDPMLHKRLDGDPARNKEIESERLTAPEIATLERAYPERVEAINRLCAISSGSPPDAGADIDDRLFHCGAGTVDFTVGYNGEFRLCSALRHPATVYDLRRGSLRQAWEDWAPKVRGLRTPRPDAIEPCRRCPLIDLCMWCPAHAALETGHMDGWSDYFCEVAHARAAALATTGATCTEQMEASEPEVPTLAVPTAASDTPNRDAEVL